MAVSAPCDTGDDPIRREEELLSIIPKDERKTFNIRKLICLIVDRDSFSNILLTMGDRW
jgi:acetyl-CoA carboxylase carboxyltransferase component